jgi:hypothetical protein
MALRAAPGKRLSPEYGLYRRVFRVSDP